jgi:putative ABC transport system permease protein
MGSYLKIAWRSVHREKLYALINIGGLGLAIGCCIVLALYLKSELSYDQHNELYRQIYRVENEFVIGGGADRFAVTSAVLGQMLEESYPEVLDYVRFRPAAQGDANTLLIRHGDDAYYWQDAYFADDNVFDIFTHEIIYGDPATALVEPGTVAVSETFARRYFGDDNPIGQTITTDSGQPNTITLVFRDLPQNTHMKYDVLFSYNANFLQTPQNTTQRRAALAGVSDYTYVLMPEGYDPQDFNEISDEFFERNLAAVLAPASGSWRAWLDPLADIHLNADVQYDRPVGNRYYIYGFAAVGLFILIIACINYVNLATARATRRARSVGIRKILGVRRTSLIVQFIGEAVLFAVLAAVLGVVLVELVTTFTPLEQLIDKQLDLDLLGSPGLAAVVLGFSALIGVVAGLYPAIYLSSWAPLTALVGENRASRGNVLFRQLLVFTQFAISISVIAATLLMAMQMRFIQNKSLGFSPENRLMISVRGVDLIERLPTLIGDLATDSRILGITTSQIVLGQIIPANVLAFEGADGVLERFVVSHMPVGDDFLKVMNMQLVTGRDFSQRLLTDVGQSVIVNEALVRRMGWDDPLGKQAVVPGACPGNVCQGRVIGVVSDFNFQSLRTGITPFAMYPFNNDFSNVPEINRPFTRRFLVLDVAREGIGATLGMLEDKFAEFDPSHPFEYRFLDESLAELYVSEQNLMRLVGIFAAVCILISCLGLYGLATFTTEQRTKEIGIRKVLGASSLQIVLLLARNILLLVVAGAVVASIGAYFAVDEWLAGFAYRASINPLVFVLATVVAAVVAFLTIALQSWGTARADPADALRYE